jgi:hypothetical protein
MRVLVAGRNAKVLAKAAGTFANDLKFSTAATKADCFTLLARTEFDLIVACETLADGSGLEVLSHVAVSTPNTLRIFAARPATLNLLKGELGLFGLFRTLPYPINFRTLWAAISLARSACGEQEPATRPTSAPAPRPLLAPAPRPVLAPARAAAHAARHVTRDVAAPPSRIPESEAFKRARARRHSGVSGAGKNDAVRSDTRSSNARRNHAGRREPVMSNSSLAQLAKLAATKRPPPQFRGPLAEKKRKALFVGSGVFAATTLAVLTFFMVRANKPAEQSTLPTIASIDQPMPHEVFPWQPDTRQPTQQAAASMSSAASVSSEASPAPIADANAEAEPASEPLGGDRALPDPAPFNEPSNFNAPPPFNAPSIFSAPPPPSEPPSLDSAAQPVNE